MPAVTFGLSNFMKYLSVMFVYPPIGGESSYLVRMSVQSSPVRIFLIEEHCNFLLQKQMPITI